MVATIAVLRGDGIGPEVVEAGWRCWAPACRCACAKGGSAATRSTTSGDPLPAETLELCRTSDAVLLGAVGGPRWEGPLRAEDGLLRLRRGLGLYANLRPARYMGLPTPLRDGLVRHADILVVRDLAGGVYFGEPRGGNATEAFNTWRQTADQVRQVAHVALPAGAPAAPEGDVRGQGERAGGLAPVAHGGERGRARVPGRGARAPLRGRGQLRAAAGAAPLRRGAHGEPVRRHPQRRGRRGGGIAGRPALGLSRQRARRSSSRCTAPPPPSPAAASRTRPAPS